MEKENYLKLCHQTIGDVTTGSFRGSSYSDDLRNERSEGLVMEGNCHLLDHASDRNNERRDRRIEYAVIDSLSIDLKRKKLHSQKLFLIVLLSLKQFLLFISGQYHMFRNKLIQRKFSSDLLQSKSYIMFRNIH